MDDTTQCPDEDVGGSTSYPPEFEERVRTVESIMEREIKARGKNAKMWHWSDFDRQEKNIGQGGYGTVFKAREKMTGFILALKLINLKGMNHYHGMRTLLRELEIHSRLKHPNILALYNYFIHVDEEGEQNICMLLEYAFHGDIYELMQKNPIGINPDLAARFIFQVTSALEYCHSMNVIHRDIKPENLLLDHNHVIKLADFGLSVHSCKERRSLVGTAQYLAPELAQGWYPREKAKEMMENDPDYTPPTLEPPGPYYKAVDNWALGILLYAFLVGDEPFNESKRVITLKRILGSKIPYPRKLGGGDYWGSIDLISKLLQTEPSKRLSFQGVKEHPWVVERTRNQHDLKIKTDPWLTIDRSSSQYTTSIDDDFQLPMQPACSRVMDPTSILPGPRTTYVQPPSTNQDLNRTFSPPGPRGTYVQPPTLNKELNRTFSPPGPRGTYVQPSTLNKELNRTFSPPGPRGTYVQPPTLNQELNRTFSPPGPRGTYVQPPQYNQNLNRTFSPPGPRETRVQPQPPLNRPPPKTTKFGFQPRQPQATCYQKPSYIQPQPPKTQPPPKSKLLPGPASKSRLPGPPSKSRLPGPPLKSNIPRPPPESKLPRPPLKSKLPGPPPESKLPRPPPQCNLPGPSVRAKLQQPRHF